MLVDRSPFERLYSISISRFWGVSARTIETFRVKRAKNELVKNRAVDFLLVSVGYMVMASVRSDPLNGANAVLRIQTNR